MSDQQIWCSCRSPAFRAASLPAVEYSAAGDLRSFNFTYTVSLLGLVERERSLSVPFSYVNGTFLEIRASQDAAHSVYIKVWSEKDDPWLGPCDPIVGKETQTAIRSSVRLRLGSSVERSFVLSQVRPQANRGNRIGMIFPAPVERALNPLYDHAAIAAVDYAENNYAWSTTHLEIHAIRLRSPDDQDNTFTDSLASYLNGLCRRCLRLFKGHGRPTISLGTESGPDERSYAMRTLTHQHRFASATLNSVAPGLHRALRSVTPESHGFAAAHWWRALRAASSPFPPSPFQGWTRRAAGKNGAGYPSPSHALPGLRQAGARGET
jgi:hypothetical protein